MPQYDALLSPLHIKHLNIRNRIMSTSHAPSYGQDGKPKERYQLYHEEKAKGGIGLAMFGGASSVDVDSPTRPWNQLDASDDEIIPYFQELAARIHGHRAALMCQLSHMGRRTRWDIEDWTTPISASAVREASHRTVAKAMEDYDIRRVHAAYAAVAGRCKDGGLDGCEFLMASNLMAQFLSPRVNRRTDAYGGSLENRLRFVLEMLEQARAAVGDDFILGVRLTGDELKEGGLSQQDCLSVIRRIAETGLVGYLNVLGGEVFSHMELANFFGNMAFPDAPYLHLPSAVKQMTDLPVFHAGRINNLEVASRAIEEGHVDMVAMTRAHMADPHIVRKLTEGRAEDIRECVDASYCADRIYLGNDALCIQNPATSREKTMPHVIPKASSRRKVVVAGAGPAGLEVARVSAERGHDVVLFEKAAMTGGQINLAAKAPWRQSLDGIVRWLDGQVDKLGVEVRLDAEATADLVRAEDPDFVVVATGGRPPVDLPRGADLAVSTWDILSGAVAPAETVLLFDDQGDHQATSCAEFMAARGARVELASRYRSMAEETGPTNFSIHLRELYNYGVVLTPDCRLTEIYGEGNRLVAVLRNEYNDAEEERAVDQVVVEQGTVPDDDLYFALKPRSGNLGEVNLRALIAGGFEPIETNPAGGFQLFRIGDATAGRNIHAAIYDALRLCKNF